MKVITLIFLIVFQAWFNIKVQRHMLQRTEKTGYAVFSFSYCNKPPLTFEGFRFATFLIKFNTCMEQFSIEGI